MLETLEPVGKRVIITPVEVAPGKLIVTNQKPSQFLVWAVGDDVTQVEEGDYIYLEKHYGVEIEHEGEKFQVIDEACILAKFSRRLTDS